MTDTTKSEDKTADDGDWLGYGVYADTLWARIEQSLKSDDLGDDPLVVGLFGEWGAGKSKLLELIHKRAVKRSKADCEKRSWTGVEPVTLTVPVQFQPWKYEHEAHLGVPLLMHLQAALGEVLEKAATPLEELFEDTEKVSIWGKKTLKSVHAKAENLVKVLKHEYVQVGLGVAAGALFTPAAGVAVTAGLNWLAETGEKMVDSTRAVQKLDAKDKPKAVSNVPLVTQDGSYYYKTHEVLRKLSRIKPLKDGETSTIRGLDAIKRPLHLNFVVFIDDLDRCLPEKAVQVLELIKTLLNVEC